jgi:hypothetical protein
VSQVLLISDYALLGDSHASALLSRDGSIDWWCAPRFDAPSLFTRLLDPEAGHWSIRPVDEFDVDRSYVGETLIMRTRFSTPTGILHLTDGLALGPREREHAIGSRSPHVLLRLVEAMAGEVRVEVDFAPRPEYGLVTPQLASTPLGLEVKGGADSLLLTSDRELRIGERCAKARLTLREGERDVRLATRHGAAEQKSGAIGWPRGARRLDRGLAVMGRHPSRVRRSLLEGSDAQCARAPSADLSGDRRCRRRSEAGWV